MRIAVRDHACRGVGRFARRLAFLDDQHAGAVTSQAPRQRQSNDTSADDHNVPSLHDSIVVEGESRDSSPRELSLELSLRAKRAISCCLGWNDVHKMLIDRAFLLSRSEER